MRVRRVTLEIEVPWSFSAKAVLECLRQGFDEIAYDADTNAVPHQEQVVNDVVSANTRIDNVV